MAPEPEDEIKDEKNPPPLDEDDIALLKTYGLGPYSSSIKKTEKEIKDMAKKVNDLCGIKESDTGLAAPSQWDLVSDKQMMQEEQPLQVARCTKIINQNSEDAKYVINVKQIAKFVVGLGDKVSPTDIEEGMRVGVIKGKQGTCLGAHANGGKAPSQHWKGPRKVLSKASKALALEPTQMEARHQTNTGRASGERRLKTTNIRFHSMENDDTWQLSANVDRNKYQIQIPLPPKIDPSVTMMTVEEKPDVTYNDVGGCKEQIEKMREVVELPMLHPEKFVKLGIDPPKGVLCYGPPGTGKTLLARAVANRTDACFIRVIGSELVQKYVGEGARMVRELFQMARSKKACIVFFDEVDAIGGARFDDGVGGDNEVQRTMLEIVNQLDGFDARGNIKVLMATNRPDTLDPALLRPGRLDRKVEFGLPDLESRTQIFKIHTRTMNCERDIRFELLARLCPNSTGADIRSVCTEAGMFAIRARRKTVTEKDFLDAVNKVIKGYQKFSATPKYM
ncbi:AAA ATPase, AAA+ lid domain, partial [Dillenia turbinata]